MGIWMTWLDIVWQLKPSCSRWRGFLWIVVILASFSVRTDYAGVASFVRGHWLTERCYKRLLDRFNGNSVDLNGLTSIWVKLTLVLFSKFLFRVSGSIVILGDGIKNPKEGRKMPGVKLCHQESNNNSKPEYVMAHSFQALSLLVKSGFSYFAVPLVCRIHEGIVRSNRDQRTLHDKLLQMLKALPISEHFYLVLDAYYASRGVLSIIAKEGNHVISRLRKNAVAYFPIATGNSRKGRGRPKLYGKKIKLKELFSEDGLFKICPSPFSGESGVDIRYACLDLMWKPIKSLARIVLVAHPSKGKWILIGTDLKLDPIRMIEMYGLRFRIELCFKQAIYQVGAFTYRFWLRSMGKLSRKSGNLYLHRATADFRSKILNKVLSYELHVQLGLISLGLLQYLSLQFSKEIWRTFGSWLRTMNPEVPPSEQVVAMAMRNSFPEFLLGLPRSHKLRKFLKGKIDLARMPAYRLAA